MTRRYFTHRLKPRSTTRPRPRPMPRYTEADYARMFGPPNGLTFPELIALELEKQERRAQKKAS